MKLLYDDVRINSKTCPMKGRLSSDSDKEEHDCSSYAMLCLFPQGDCTRTLLNYITLCIPVLLSMLLSVFVVKPSLLS